MRFLVEIQYNGTNYSGWQIQPNATTIQGVLEDKLAKKIGEKVKIVGCGRTDAGVHAKQFFFHLDTKKKLDESFRQKINYFLPPDIFVKNIKRVEDYFHSRFDAKKRTYLYFVTTQKNPFKNEFCAAFYHSFDLKIMNEGCNVILNTKEFNSFAKLGSDINSYKCDIYDCFWQKKNNGLLIFQITANRFLRSMIRLMVGTMIDLGRGKISIEKFQKIVEQRDNTKASAAAPSKGLFLNEIIY